MTSFLPSMLTPPLPALKYQGSLGPCLGLLFSHIRLTLDHFSSSVASIVFSMGTEVLKYGCKFFNTPTLSKYGIPITLSTQEILKLLGIHWQPF